MNKKIRLHTRYYSTGMEKDGSYDIRNFGYKYETQELDFDKTAFFLIDVYGKGYDDEFREV